ncbi:gas vesicle protein GvpJ [Actinacidiphila acidipaludis]|uniref:Gas vesicle protein A n=1 Tax=Actinacidiphila acidipaludis TaxID=2873382 RepID=A0ABS7QGD4_9ACTN|nr:gas vesicle protein GvpJ [Streptomyces acidipaludis]MBY8882223.1 gas vesicle structural protein GvpA [Streptomyces acidipaludis]
MTMATQSGTYMDRPSGGGLVDVVDLILDKGLVIDVYLRVSLVGIELLTVDARIVVASVDTYLRFAEAANRLDLARSGTETKGLPGMMQEIREGGAQQKTKGALEGAKDSVKDTVGGMLGGGSDEDAEDQDGEAEESRQPKHRSRPASRKDRSR